MKTMKTDQARRALLKGIAAIPVVSVTGYQATAFADATLNYYQLMILLQRP